MKKIPYFLIILLVGHLLLLANIRFTAWPEMLSYPYLFLNKFKLYTDFIYPYPPLLTLVLAGFYKILGFKILTLKLVSWSFILASDVFLFLIVKKFLKKDSLVFLLLIPYLLLQTFLDGNMLWFDNALVLPTVASLYFLVNWTENKRRNDLLWVSILLTAAVFMKQTAAVYFLATAAFILSTPLLHSDRLRALKLFFITPIVSGIAFLLYLALTNSLRDFWLWNFYYPLTFWSRFPGYVDLSLSLGEKAVLGLTFLPVLGAFLIRKKIISARGGSAFGRKDKLFLLLAGFLAASLIAVYPRFSYFHLQPTFAILFVGFAIIFRYLKRLWYLALIAVVTLLAIYPSFNQSFVKSVRFFDEDDQKVIKIVSALSTKNEKVYLVGLFSSAYVFADRLPPKPWADNFGWYWEIPGETEKIISKFENDPPGKIFYKVPERGNWFDLGVYRPQKLVEYMNKYYYRDSEPIAGIELWKRKSSK